MRYSARRALDSMSPTTASRQPSPSATLTGARSPSPKAGGHKKRGSSSPVYKQTPNKSFHARITSALKARLAGSRIYGLFVRQSGGIPAVKERSGKHRHPEPRSPYRRIRQAHPPASHASSGSPAREKPAGSAPNGTLVWQDVDHQSDSASDGDQFVPLTPYSVDLNDQVSHALNSGCPTSTELSDANADIMGHKLETIIQMLQRQQQGEYDMAATFERVLRKRFHKIQPVFKPIFFAAAQGILTTQHVCALVEGTEYAGSTSDARMRMQTLLSKDLDTTAAEQAYAKVFIHPQVWFAAWGILMVLVEQLSGPEPLLRALERTLEYVTKQSKAYQWSAVVAYMARFHNLKTVITNGRIVPEHWYHDDDFLEASYLTPKRRLKDIGFFEQQVRSTKRSHTRIGREIAPCIEWNRSKDECWTGTACRSAMDHVCSKCGNRNHRAFEHNDRVSPSDQDREGVAGM